jgi:tetratricopeptide (TPR) repeat protein
LFAIHPLRVESVVWIEERKDVLSGVFFMLTLGAYLFYTRRRSVARYLTMSILFAGGLLSKPMLVTTPVVLLLLDYWPLGRWQSGKGKEQRPRARYLVIEKIPLFAMSAVVAYLTSKGIASAHSAADQLPLLARVGNACVSYFVYIWQTIWPAKLGIFYPFPPDALPNWQPILAATMLLLISIAAFSLRKSRPYLFVGWFCYFIMLLPVIGVVQFTLQAHADRYTYLPQIGLLLIIAWGVADLVHAGAVRRVPAVVSTNLRWAFGLLCIGAVLACAVAARIQVSYWRDSETLWSHTIAVTNDNYFAHASLADLLMREGRLSESIAHSEEALRIRPGDADAQNNLGLALLQNGDLGGAAEHLRKALQIDSGHLNAEVNLAWLLATAPDASLRDGQKAVQLAEDVVRRLGHPNAIVLRTLAAAYAETGHFDDAIAAAQDATQIARATGNTGLASDLENNIAAYRSNQPLRSGR